MKSLNRPVATLFTGNRVRERNIKATVAYDGTDFFGWQVQPALRTAQGVIEEKLTWLLREEVRLSGAGRTDKGVHASGQVFSFLTCCSIPTENLQRALNMTLPGDIFIKDIMEVPSGFHARYSARRRTYQYRLGMWGTPRSPFENRYCWYPGKSLDITAIEEAIRLFPGIRDFRALAKQRELGENTNCEIHNVSWERTSYGCLFEITANRFLPQMVRRILSTLIDIGARACSVSSLEAVLRGEKESSPVSWVAPPQGLFLHNVSY